MRNERYAEEEAEPLIGPGRKDVLLMHEPPEVRAGFIQKVYGVLSAQLLLTAAVAAPFVLDEGLKSWIRDRGFPLVFLALVAMFVFIVALMCPCGCERHLRTFPSNYLILGGFTLIEGILVGFTCAHYTADSVLFACLATAILVGGLSAYAMYTKTDFTGIGVYLFAACFALLGFGFLAMFTEYPFLHQVYCCCGILLFSVYLIYDTQLIMGRGELALGVDDYVFASLMLYTDIISLFLDILRLTGDKDDGSGMEMFDAGGGD